MADYFFQLIHDLMLSPEVLFFALVLATFVLEDAATIGAVGLAIVQSIDAIWAYSAVLIGIILGDIGLYYIGYYAEKNAFLKRKTEKHNLQKYKQKIHDHSVTAILTSRFIPGARTPTYLAMGYFHVPFIRFFMAAAIAVGIWTSFLFWGLYYIGNLILPYVSGWFSIVIAIFIVTFCLFVTKLKSHRKNKG